MKALIIGSSFNLKKIGESLIDNVGDLIFLDYEHSESPHLNLSNNKKVTFHYGDIKEMDVLIKAGLEDSGIVIIDTQQDIESLFVAQKCNINLSSNIFILLNDVSISNIFENLGFIILDSNNLKLDKIIKYVEKSQ